MAEVNFAGATTPLGRYLTSTGFGAVQSMVGVRQTPVLGSAVVQDAIISGLTGTGIIATFNDAAVAGAGSNNQEILNAPQNWRGYVLGLEVGVPATDAAGTAGTVTAGKIGELFAYTYMRITTGGVDTDIPLVSCARFESMNDGITPVAAGSSAGRNPYFFSSPLFWPGDGSEVVRLMGQQDSPLFAAALAYNFTLTLHVALGRSQENSQIQAGFGGATNCADGDEYMAAAATAASVRRSLTG